MQQEKIFPAQGHQNSDASTQRQQLPENAAVVSNGQAAGRCEKKQLELDNSGNLSVSKDGGSAVATTLSAFTQTAQQESAGVSKSTQSDVGGMNSFYSNKCLKPCVILEEGITAHENYLNNQGSYILLACTSTQTINFGHSTFHKATQMPEMSYNPYTNKNIVTKKPDFSGEAEKVATLQVAGRVTSPQADPAVISKLHKATQHPDKEYADPGHPPPPAPPFLWSDQQAIPLQQSQLMQQQLLLQQQSQTQQPLPSYPYYYVDPNTGLPFYNPLQQYAANATSADPTHQNPLLSPQPPQQWY